MIEGGGKRNIYPLKTYKDRAITDNFFSVHVMAISVKK